MVISNGPEPLEEIRDEAWLVVDVLSDLDGCEEDDRVEGAEGCVVQGPGQDHILEVLREGDREEGGRGTRER